MARWKPTGQRSEYPSNMRATNDTHSRATPSAKAGHTYFEAKSALGQKRTIARVVWCGSLGLIANQSRGSTNLAG